MLTTQEAEARVARGAAHLDRVKPGWEHRIDTGTLTLSDACGCIVGQLANGGRWVMGDEDAYRRYTDTWMQLWARSGGGEWNGVFLMFGDREGYALLQDAWIQEIARRLHPSRAIERSNTEVCAVDPAAASAPLPVHAR